MSVEKYLAGIIHEQNEALRLAVETIDHLNTENSRLKNERGTDTTKDKTIHTIKALMAQKGMTAAHIGKGLGLTRQAVTGVINGHGRSRKVEGAIARALGVKVSTLWPIPPRERVV